MERDAASPAFAANEIVFSVGQSGNSALYRIGLSGGTPSRLPLSESASEPAWAAGRLVFSSHVSDANIWQVTLDGKAAPMRIIASTKMDVNPQFSPDGKQIAFSSNRSGFEEVWVAQADGASPRPLTSFRGPATGTPRWSPDGRAIALNSMVNGQWEIFVIQADGSGLRRLTDHPAQDVVPSWSKDGRWIYFSSNRRGSGGGTAGTYQVWKVDAAGGEPQQVTADGGFVAFEAPDGRLYYTKTNAVTSSLWESGREVIPAVMGRAFQVAAEGLYFVPPPGREIHFHDFATGKASVSATLPGRLYYGMSVSPDRKHVVYTQMDRQGSDLMWVDGFRD
jgi:Tol biopolymer transport system component